MDFRVKLTFKNGCGQDTSESYLVAADDADAACARARFRLRDSAHTVRGAVISHPQLLGPSPSNWVEFAAYVSATADRAKAYIIENVKRFGREGLFMNDFWLSTPDGENREVRGIVAVDDLNLALFDVEIEEVVQDLMTFSDWIALAAIVEERLAR